LIGLANFIKSGKPKKRKIKAIEFRFAPAEEVAGDISDLTAIRLKDRVEEEFLDKEEVARFIYSLTTQETTLMVLKHVGYNRDEIIEIMHLHDKLKYQRINDSIKIHAIIFNKFRNK
jgi:hypothetical protein